MNHAPVLRHFWQIVDELGAGLVLVLFQGAYFDMAECK